MIFQPEAHCHERNRNGTGRTSRGLLAALILASLVGIDRSATAQEEKDGSLFENVVQALEQGYFDEDFRRDRLPDIVERYRKQAYEAKTLQAQREVVHAMLFAHGIAVQDRSGTADG